MRHTCFQMKLYDSRSYTFMIHRLSSHSDSKAKAFDPKSAPSLPFKLQVLVFPMLGQLL